MSDIVERLRLQNDCLLGTGHDFSDVLLDAANEIERLRELLLEAAPYVIYWRKNQIDLATEEADDWNRLRFRLWKWCNDQEALGD